MLKYIILALLWQPFLVFADTILLKDGKTIQGRIIRQNIINIEIILPDNKTITIPKKFRNLITNPIHTIK